MEDATQCKFESTSNAQDEVVLLNIVQVWWWWGVRADAVPAFLGLSCCRWERVCESPPPLRVHAGREQHGANLTLIRLCSC